jgi:branched-chain amino acid transport system substrate-binding protein
MSIAATSGIRSKRRRAAAVLAASVLLLAACGDDSSDDEDSSPNTSTEESPEILGEANPAEGSPVRVGFVTAEGGSAADLPQTRESAEAAVAYANDYLGGLAGHEIELVTCEDRSDGASGTACANQFVEQGVVAVVAGQVADEGLYMPALEAAGIPWVISSPTGGKALGSPTAFGISGGFIGGLGAMAALAQDEGMDSAVFFGIDVPAFTAGMSSLGGPAFEKAGVALDVVPIAAGTPDATPQVTAALGDDPDMIVVVAEQTLCKALLPAIHNLADEDTTLIMGDPCTDAGVLETVGNDAVEGALIYNASASLGDDDAGQLYRAVLEEYAPETNPQGKTGVGYIATLALVHAVNQVSPTGELTAAVISDALKAAKDVPVPGWPEGTFTCDRTAFAGAPALCSTNALFGTVHDGQLTDFQVRNGAEFLGG